MKKTIVTALLACFVVSASSAEAETIDIKVKGLVCDFCARAMEKTLQRTGKTEDIEIDLNKGQVRIETRAGQSMTDQEIEQAITDSGYHLVEISRE